MYQERTVKSSQEEPVIDVEWFRRELYQERQFRLEQLTQLSYETAAPCPHAVAEVQAALKAGARRALAEIEAALIRLSRGTFGACEVCGEVMPMHRLEAIPTTRLCLRCEHRRRSR
jgi:RNA polymerase-binding transcription factor DksA